MATLKDELTAKVIEYEHWAKRRRFGRFGPTDRRLWVLACMDERLPINEALGINVDSPVAHGDAHCFRNAGGIVTDDAIRSAMLSTNFFGTTEIVIVQHTQCGMLSANARDLEAYFKAKGIDTDQLILDPTLPELKLDRGGFAKWIGMTDDVDEALLTTIEVFENHPLIPDEVTISGWVWEVETRRLRPPTRDPARRARTDATARDYGVTQPQPARWHLGNGGEDVATTTDPVCGMELVIDRAAGHRDVDGDRRYFCSQVCLDSYDTNPARYLVSETLSG
ncbi:carbonic anhydrase [Mycobacterium kansasii]|nr:carbonic anhydrase [Mycobacterium kansasii]